VWEDFDNDGRFETHLRYDEDWVLHLSVDTDGDGEADTELSGTPAESFLQERWRPEV
jgi:hypothetical protein